MNNPAFKAYLEAKRKFPNAKKFVVCSLGTGFFQSKLQGLEEKGWPLWVGPLIGLMMNASSNIVDDNLKNLRTDLSTEYFHYYRFQRNLPDNIPLDDTNEDTLDKLREIANNIITNDNDFNCLIDEIVEKLRTAPAP